MAAQRQPVGPLVALLPVTALLLSASNGTIATAQLWHHLGPAQDAALGSRSHIIWGIAFLAVHILEETDILCKLGSALQFLQQNQQQVA